MLAHVWTHLKPQAPKKEKKATSTKHRKTRGFLAAGLVGGRGRGPLSPTERRELPYGNATARGPLAGFKRLRATAGQGPNYVGPFCGILGLCWPILNAMWVHLGAMLAYLESYVGRS